ncbi:MAG: ABC transporter permease subunit [Oscillospiraceae bacterium]|nr:ABC transporter permease subunit [Oscillospiraceae bacterium]
MIRYVIKRILWLIPLLIVVSFIVFALMEAAPGTIVDNMITGVMTEEEIAELRSQFNLDRPMIYRYWRYMLNLVQGDLGVSDTTGISVWNTYIDRLPNTLILTLASLVVGLSISIPMGILAARRAGKLIDTLTTSFTMIGMSMPSFFLGLLLILIFAHELQWLPAAGNRDGFRSLILPGVCSGLMLMAASTRQTRSSMLEVLSSDYLRTARAKGVPEKSVIRKHALGNAWIPILTTVGNSLGISIAGSAVIEVVFAWPGVGRMTVDAVMARDVTTATGAVIMTTVLYVLLQLLVDLSYVLVDPRIKAQYVVGAKRKRRNKKRAEKAPPQVVIHLNKPASVPDVKITETPAAQEVEVIVAEPEPQVYVSAQSEDVPKAATTHASVQVNQSTDNGDTLVSKKYKKRSHVVEIFHNMKKSKSAMAGLFIVGLLFIIFIGSLFISFESVTATSPQRFHPPSAQNLFGTDNMGRDLFLRTIYGTRYSIAIGFGSVGIAALIGIFFGAVAGFYGGAIDDIIMRASDILASIPSILLGMVIVIVLGQSLQNLIIAVGVNAIPIFIRITRAAVLTVRGQEFVEAAKAVGLSNIRIVFTQVLPNSFAPLIVTITASLGIAIIVGASLSFLGFGVPVPAPEWGTLVSAGRDFIRTSPWLMTFPSIFIMLTVLAFNLLGDGLRDALDPKLKKR